MGNELDWIVVCIGAALAVYASWRSMQKQKADFDRLRISWEGGDLWPERSGRRGLRQQNYRFGREVCAVVGVFVVAFLVVLVVEVGSGNLGWYQAITIPMFGLVPHGSISSWRFYHRTDMETLSKWHGRMHQLAHCLVANDLALPRASKDEKYPWADNPWYDCPEWSKAGKCDLGREARKS